MKLASILADGSVSYFTDNKIVIGGRLIFNPSVDTLRLVGIYPVVLVSGTGTDGVVDGDHIAVHTGNADYTDPDRAAVIKAALADDTQLVPVLERIIAGLDVTDEDRQMAMHRILMRGELSSAE